ncbi:MAG: signal peptidase I, partial [Candidatus Yanofskybacteria bacterium]|nr:signal peptidase I [Candidatus Yanofskybacteria bacterium]
MEEKSSFAESVKEFVKFLVIASAIALPVRYFIAQPFIVRGASMEPNFENREYLIVDELSYFFREPQRGEVIIFRYPLDPRQFFIKRIVGLPGERVEIKDGKVLVKTADGAESVRLEEPYLSDSVKTEGVTVAVLGRGDYFVLRDNRTQSSDGRAWGPLPRHLIVG